MCWMILKTPIRMRGTLTTTTSTFGPFGYHGLNKIRTWISNPTHDFMWSVITPTWTKPPVKLGHSPLFYDDVITYPLIWSLFYLTFVVKRSPLRWMNTNCFITLQMFYSEWSAFHIKSKMYLCIRNYLFNVSLNFVFLLLQFSLMKQVVSYSKERMPKKVEKQN